MREFMRITKALADANRVRMLLALGGRELCVCQMNELCGLAPSTISKHLSVLYQAGLIESRKTQQWVFYRLPGRDASAVVCAAIDWTRKSLRETPQIVEDRRKLEEILKLDPRAICRRQGRR